MHSGTMVSAVCSFQGVFALSHFMLFCTASVQALDWSVILSVLAVRACLVCLNCPTECVCCVSAYVKENYSFGVCVCVSEIALVYCVFRTGPDCVWQTWVCIGQGRLENKTLHKTHLGIQIPSIAIPHLCVQITSIAIPHLCGCFLCHKPGWRSVRHPSISLGLGEDARSGKR